MAIMKKWNLLIDVALCENCNNCALATKDEHIGNDFPGYAAPQPRHGHDWIKILRKVRGGGHMVDAAHVPTMCNHCDDAPCVRAGGGAVIKRDDGIVLIDPQKAKGRRDIVASCPYGAIWWNEELQLPQKWIFEAHLLDQGWPQPRGAHACPTGAMRAIKIEDKEMQERAKEENLEVLEPALGAHPRVYYRNLHRFNKCFIGGSVVANVNGVKECISGANVELRGDRKHLLDQSTTDAFGDFKFDRIEPDSGPYKVTIKHSQYGSAAIDVVVAAESVYAGDILLS
jgi:Fe-S-cluster-containing dehydrogenase component